MEDTILRGIKINCIENFEKNKQIIENMICCVCLNVIIKPMECNLCKTILCEECLNIINLAGKKCIFQKL